MKSRFDAFSFVFYFVWGNLMVIMGFLSVVASIGLFHLIYWLLTSPAVLEGLGR